MELVGEQSEIHHHCRECLKERKKQTEKEESNIYENYHYPLVCYLYDIGYWGVVRLMDRQTDRQTGRQISGQAGR